MQTYRLLTILYWYLKDCDSKRQQADFSNQTFPGKDGEIIIYRPAKLQNASIEVFLRVTDTGVHHLYVYSLWLFMESIYI